MSASPQPANKNLFTQVAPVPFANVLAVSTISPDSTITGKTLEALKTSALADDLKELVLWPEDVSKDITWAISGNVDANSPQLPSGGITLAITKTRADTIKLFCTATAKITMIELG